MKIHAIKYSGVLLKIVMIFTLSCNTWATSTPLNIAKWNQLKKDHQSHNWIAVLWSLECPPCYQELAHISTLVQKNANLNVVIINTDASDAMLPTINQIIQKYQLSRLTNLHFADEQAAQSRYIIDPNWYGELPRSYFFNEQGDAQGHSGLIGMNVFNDWLR